MRKSWKTIDRGMVYYCCVLYVWLLIKCSLLGQIGFKVGSSCCCVFSSFFNFVHLVVVLITEGDVNPADILPAYSGQYKSTSAWNTSVSLISAFFFLG